MAETKREWVDLVTEKDADIRTSRLKVPGGWLYRVIVEDRVAIAYVPDPMGSN
jgi:hypothetical protein